MFRDLAVVLSEVKVAPSSTAIYPAAWAMYEGKVAARCCDDIFLVVGNSKCWDREEKFAKQTSKYVA